MLIAELNFIKSEFAGLLPKPYMKGSLPEVTRVIPTGMNDYNREEISRLVLLHFLLKFPDLFRDLYFKDFPHLKPIAIVMLE